jgi:hypothetical protein
MLPLIYIWFVMTARDAQVENNRFLIVRRYRDLPDALLLKSVLDSTGIECFLVDETTIRMNWLWSNALGRIKVCAREADADTAAGVLAQSVPTEFAVAGIGEYRQPRCPNCQSLDTSFSGLNKSLSFATVWIGVPFPVRSSDWECESCGHRWERPNEEPLSTS